MKILNLYAGIGGNRKLWGNEHEITAVENNEEIAAIYKEYFPNDNVIIGDAHEYLLKHYKEYDFIWSSPPCQSHSGTNHFLNAQGIVRFPDMKLWQEIIFLQHFYKGKYVVENVKTYYEPLIKPQESSRHYFWANFQIPKTDFKKQIGRMNGSKKTLHGHTTHPLRTNNHSKLGFDLSTFKLKNKEQLLNNCVNPDLGLYILEQAMGVIRQNSSKQKTLFLIYLLK